VIAMNLSASSSSSRMRIVAVALCASLLAACASTRGLAPQSSPNSPDKFAARHTLSGVALTPAAWPQRDWWKSLGDPQLDALIDAALTGNPSLDAADARVRVALAQAGAQDAARKPHVNAQAEYTSIRVPASVAPAPIGGHYLGVDLLTLSAGWSPDLWGGKRAAWEAAVDQAHAAQVDARAARLNLSSNIAQAWVELAHASESQDVAQRELERATNLRKLVAQRVQAGIDNAIQLRQADTAVATAQRGAETAAEQAALLRATLAMLIGQGPDRGLQIGRPQALAATALELPSDLPSELLARRPDIVAARWRVEAAQRGIQAAKAQFYPSVNLSATLGLASMGLNDLFSLPSRYAQVAPAISLPVFDGGRLRAGLFERDANYDLAVAHYNDALVNSLHEVAEQVITLRAIETQTETQKQALDAAQAAHDLAMKRYRSGLSSYLDALSTEQALLRAEQQLADLSAQRMLASVRLVQALGGGFEPDASTQPATAAAVTH
jgi:NodT family efflux transporter outer membrane factor (OMF) lipoprotein